MSPRFCFMSLVAVVALTACGNNPSNTPDAKETVDAASVDAAIDAPPGTPDASPDAGFDAMPAPAICTVTAGDATKLITGTVLTPTGILANGQVAINASGVITCVGASCPSPTATRIDCPMGVISPGLINTHDHITYTQNSPYTDTGERYEQRHDWRRGQRGHTKLTTPGNASADQIRWGELRFLFGGATSTVGSGGQSGLLRNLDQAANQEGLNQPAVQFETFPLDDSGGTQITSTCNYGAAPDTTAKIASYASYEPHVAEGIDGTARNEFTCISDPTYDTTAPGLATDLVKPQTAIIHGVGLKPYDYGIMAIDGTALIWSPRSNITLYGDTAGAPIAARLGVQIALGTDWSATGSINLLRELSCADFVNKTYWNDYFTDQQLWQMVTENAASVTATDDVIGTVATGKVADLAIFDARFNTGYRAVLNAEPKDVVLVLRGGKPLYGEDATITALSTGCDAVDVCGNAKQVCLMSEIGKTYDQLKTAVGTDYAAFFCGTPINEPSCVAKRPAAVNNSTIYTGMPSATDLDGDGIANASDNCPDVFNPIRPLDNGVQADNDSDTVGDACDVCPVNANTTTCATIDPNDRDADGVTNALDNCPDIANTQQEDGDLDGKGDVCDACPAINNPGTQGCPVSIYSIKNGTTPVGAVVRVTNAIVTGKGSNGFFIQVKPTLANGMADPAYLGPDYSGMFVFTAAASPFLTSTAVGNRVDIDATVTLFNGQIELATISAVTVTSAAVEAAPDPITVTAAEATTGGLRAAKLEGVLVKTAAVTITAVDTLNAEVTANDGAGAIAVDDFLYLPAPLPAVGTAFGSITGVLALRNNVSKIEPRAANDYAPATLAIAALTPAKTFVDVGAVMVPTRPTALTVTLNQPAPVDTAVAVTSSDNAVARAVGDAVTVKAGETTAVVMVSSTAKGTATLTATLGVSFTASVQALDGTEVPVLIGLTPTTATVAPGGTQTFTVGLDIPAPTGGTAVALTLTPPTAGTIPPTVTVLAGTLTAPFDYVDGSTVTSASVTATPGAASFTSPITVVEPPMGHLVINEVDYDQAGTDAASYIEIYNPTNAAIPLTDIAVALVNGSNNGEYLRFNLVDAGATLDAGKYLVIRNAGVTVPAGVLTIDATGDWFQNGPDGLALINASTTTVIDALSYEGELKTVTLTGFTGTVSLVEMTAFTGADTGDNVNSLSRTPNGADSDVASADWQVTATKTPGVANP